MSLKNSHSQIKETEKRYKEQQEFLQCLKSVLKCSKKYSDSAAELATSGNEFARELSSLSKKECISPYEKMVQFLFDYSTVMNQLGSVCTQMLDQMQTEFYNALAQFIDHGFNEAHAYKSKMEEAQASYDNALTRIDELASKKGKLDEAKMISMEEELNHLKSAVTATSEEFNASMEHLDANKEFKFLRCMYQHAELQTTYFLVGHKLYANLMGKIDPVKKHLEHLDTVSPYKNIFEGNLMKKGKNLGGWKKIWVVLKQGQLIMIKGKKVRKLDMRLCTVRMANSVNMQQMRGKDKDSKDKDKDKDSNKEHAEYTFEIVSAQKKYMFHTETAQERDKWVKAIQNSISNSLNASNFDKEKPTTESVALKILKKDSGNLVCADCDGRDPDWASINLGIIVCLECSGVHRSLGTHISKVRSLTLDKWDPELLLFMKTMGNNNSNSIYEFNVLTGYSKPTKNTDRESRERYIKAKYVTKDFIPTTCLNQIELCQALCTMVSDEPDNLLGVMLLLAQGADPNAAIGAATTAGNILFYTALIQNGAHATTALHSTLTLDDVENSKNLSNIQFALVSSPTSASIPERPYRNSPKLPDRPPPSIPNRPPPSPLQLLPPPPPLTLPPPLLPPPPTAPLPPTPFTLPASPPQDIPPPISFNASPIFTPPSNSNGVSPIFTPPSSPPSDSPISQQQRSRTFTGGNSMSSMPLPVPLSNSGGLKRSNTMVGQPTPPKLKKPPPPIPSPTSLSPPSTSPRNQVEQLFLQHSQQRGANSENTQHLHHQIQQQLQQLHIAQGAAPPGAQGVSVSVRASMYGGQGKMAPPRKVHSPSNSTDASMDKGN